MAPVIAALTMTVLAAAPVDDAARRRVLELERERIEVIDRAAPACVCIFDEDRSGGGSGVIIDEEGYGVTNFHVVAGLMQSRAGVGGLNDGRLYPLQVLGIDVTGDVAMFRLTGKDRFAWAELGDSDAVRVGDEVMAMGNPFTLSDDYQPTVTVGIVSGLHRYQGEGETLVYTDCIQTDASINPGNSGGPLFDRKGRVIGINGRISAEMHEFARGRFNVGLGYAISINQIKRFLPHLRAGLPGRHGTLDATVTDDVDRVIFDQLYEDGPAWNAGIRVGDRLLRFGGQDIRSANHFASVLGTYPENWQVPISFESRAGVKHRVVRLAPVFPQMERPYETPEAVNRLALREALDRLRRAVRGQGVSTGVPRTWRWRASRTGSDGRITAYLVRAERGRATVRSELGDDDAVVRRIEADDAEVALIEGDRRYVAGVVDTLVMSAMRALRGPLLAEDAWQTAGATHRGGDALVRIDDEGRTTGTRLLESIHWPLSPDVEMHVGLERETGLPAHVFVRDVPTDTAVQIELDDYRESGGVVWPHRMRVAAPEGTFEETTSELTVEW